MNEREMNPAANDAPDETGYAVENEDNIAQAVKGQPGEPMTLA